jgi:hypothetical protein
MTLRWVPTRCLGNYRDNHDPTIYGYRYYTAVRRVLGDTDVTPHAVNVGLSRGREGRDSDDPQEATARPNTPIQRTLPLPTLVRQSLLLLVVTTTTTTTTRVVHTATKTRFLPSSSSLISVNTPMSARRFTNHALPFTRRWSCRSHIQLQDHHMGKIRHPTQDP